ncbi:MAG TPA: hypothetical protein VND98_11925 [Solirubrobacterales bacterium]|nr:hypothetical protein [Solirubrobacterales bacterium]
MIKEHSAMTALSRLAGHFSALPAGPRGPKLGLRLALLATLSAAALLLVAGPAAAASPPEWKVTVAPNAEYFLSGSRYVGNYKVEAENVGETETSGAITIKDIAPLGLVLKEAQLYFLPVGDVQIVHPGTPEEREVNWEHSFRNISFSSCTVNSGGISAECTFPAPPMEILPLFCLHYEYYCGVGPGVKHGQRLIMSVRAEVPATVTGSLEDFGKVSGGGVAGEVEASTTNIATAGEPPTPGHLGFEASITDSSGNPYRQAGGHPYQFSTEFNFETYSGETLQTGEFGRDGVAPVHDPRNLTAEMPPGLVVNPQAVPHCTLADYFSEACEEIKDAVGTSCIRAFARSEGHCHLMEPVFNLEPERSFPAEFGITVGHAPFIVVTTGVNSLGDYSATATNVAIQVDTTRVRLTLWGVPANQGHDKLRAKGCQYVGDEWITEAENWAECEAGEGVFLPNTNGGPAEVAETPFLTLPTECSGKPLTVKGRYDTWSLPAQYAENSVNLPSLTGCNHLSFTPKIEAHPTTNIADAPSGLIFHLQIPQNEDPKGVATPELKEAVVKLPAGLTLNPSGANGLEGCTEAQIGLRTEAPAHCPDASKLGLVEVESPLLREEMKGSLFLATPRENPSHSFLAGYLAIEGQGVRVKLPGRFATDPQTGQITVSFPEQPQLPFENLTIKTLIGARAALRTPPICGPYVTTAELTPFSAPESGLPATSSASFETSVATGGSGTCPASAKEEPNAPLLRAGTENTRAGAFSPFSLRLVREDGSQELSRVETTLPPGLTAKLAGIPYCSEAAIAQARSREHEGGGAEEKASPSCPASSEVGTVDVGAGAGPTPVYVSGHAYLAGPYKGAPLSLAIVTSAIAGPFDLGTVVVRVALNVNPETAQIRAVSDEIPHILQGIPLDIRSVALKLSRQNFTLNPTSCDKIPFTGDASSVLNLSAPLAAPFQVGGCQVLPFAPKLVLGLKGSTKRAGNPALKAALTTKPGEANIASVQVTLPHSEFLDNAHLHNVCTNVQFAAHQCPSGSVYGHATAETPLLDHPLEGPVYLRSSTHKLPDLVADLEGQIQIVLDGRIDSIHGGIRNTFEAIPDAPVSRFTLEMQGGKKGLLENSTNICATPKLNRAAVLMGGQNGKAYATDRPLKVSCGRRHKRRHKRHHLSNRRRRSAHR